MKKLLKFLSAAILIWLGTYAGVMYQGPAIVAFIIAVTVLLTMQLYKCDHATVVTLKDELGSFGNKGSNVYICTSCKTITRNQHAK